VTIKAILFDLDDTLYDEKEFVKSGFFVVSEYIGSSYEIDKIKFYKDLINIFKKGLRGNIFNLALEKENISYDEKIISKMIDVYRNHTPKIFLDKGIKKLLNEVKNNYLLGLRDREKEDIFASSAEDEYTTGNKYGIENGDIVILDKKHKIICGDSTDPNIIRKILGENVSK